MISLKKFISKILNTENNTCINCAAFCLWDGDFCCLDEMKILATQPDKGLFNEDVVNEIESHKGCKKWKKSFGRKFLKEEYDKYLNNKNTQ